MILILTQSGHSLQALVSHSPASARNEPLFAEHVFNRGHILGVANNTKSGYLVGDLQHSNGSTKLARYPKFKVQEKVIDAPFRAFG